MVGRREPAGAPFSALIHLVPSELASRADGRFGHRSRPAAGPRRNRRPVRASSRMPKKRADFIRRLGRKNVLELAGLLLDFRLAVHGQAIGKETLRQPMPPDDAARAL